MDWIRRNFLFSRKNKSSEKDVIRAAGVAADNVDDEFIDIVEESKPVVELIEPTEPTAETEKPVLAKVSKKKPAEIVEEVTGESEADQPAAASTEPRQVSKKPRPVKKPISTTQQPNTQLRNNIIHQPR